ncbi:MAG TPA: NAD-binding protein [Gaiellaceae bacterium]|nr:NAD-binding protein [Gaiellaceae bacterium]
MEQFSFRRFAYATSALFAVLVVGMIGFRAILGESWIDAFYRATVTVSLTGIDSKPRGEVAEVFTIVLLLAGVAIFAYIAGAIVELIARGVLTGAWADRRRRQKIDALRDHYIICGYGRVGRRIGEEFREAGVPYVVLDFGEDALEAAREHGDHYVEGDGTEDEDLEAAGLTRARGLVASSDSDADNLYITLSARTARPDLMIVARASDDAAARKLRLAGADRVVQPYAAAGRVMAGLMLKPQVTAFIDVVMTASGDLHFEEIEVTKACGQGGKSIRDLDIRKETGALVVALRKEDGTFDTTPTPEARVEVGDVLIAAGTTTELRALEDLFAPREAIAG